MDIAALMKQAKKMQKDLKVKEEELQSKIYEGTVNGGVVNVVVTGRNQIESIEIDESLLEKGNKEILQDMILMATNQALGKMIEDKDDTMQELTDGVKLPGMF
ncbi:MAG: YbaB/EbfC family nucleoid-associated protein [Bacilli bacterium]|nr:YbaB/EbfC family nucleoid-associated protein [Bacilli bacterium]